MNALTENTIEQSFIDQLVSQGYTYYNDFRDFQCLKD
jgi:hypothetical protein